MSNKTKYIYFFRGTLSSHVGIYKSWVDLAIANGLRMEMLTVMNLISYIKEYGEVRKYRDIDYLKILISPHPIFNRIIISLYFIFLSIKYKRIVVHLRKREPKNKNLFYFRINKKYRAFGYINNNQELIVTEISDHQ